MHGGMQAGRRELRKSNLFQDPLTARAGEMDTDSWVQRLDSGFVRATGAGHERTPCEGRGERAENA